jgi:group I intron endonuclease
MEEVKPYGVIYCLTCKINGKVYIGQTTDFNDRMYRYQTLRCKRQPLIYRALKKHGVDNFNYEIIDTGSSSDSLTVLEAYHMRLSLSRDRAYGYNDREAGSKGKLSEETKQKLSEINKGKKPFLGRKHTEDAKKKLSDCNKGNSFFLGCKHTEETKKKISEKSKGNKSHLGHKHSEEAKKKMSDSVKKRNLKKNMDSLNNLVFFFL